jgi:hypothetical protein
MSSAYRKMQTLMQMLESVACVNFIYTRLSIYNENKPGGRDSSLSITICKCDEIYD